MSTVSSPSLLFSIFAASTTTTAVSLGGIPGISMLDFISRTTFSGVTSLSVEVLKIFIFRFPPVTVTVLMKVPGLYFAQSW